MFKRMGLKMKKHVLILFELVLKLVFEQTDCPYTEFNTVYYLL